MKLLPLVKILEKEQILLWENFENPEALIAYLAEHLGINPEDLDSIQRIFVGEDQPEFDNIWFNNSNTPFIGIPVNGRFFKFYRFPTNAPFVSVDNTILQEGVRQLTTDEVTGYNLPTLNSPAFWAILEVANE